MFDALPEGDALAAADDAALVAAITGWTHAEAAASARRLAAIAELVNRRAVGSTDRAEWSCDNWDAMAAEVSAAQGVSHGTASGQMYLAVALRDRLPKVAALFADGVISARLVATIAWHTYLIKDADALALVDTMLAKDAARYGPLSVNKTAQAIDAVVDRYDPGALRRTRVSARSREVVIDQSDDESGTARLWGRLYATDAVVLDRRLLQMAHEVCVDDPRTIAQRRADALGALVAGAEQLTCACDNEECPARAAAGKQPAGVVIHVVAGASTLDCEPDQHMSGEVQSRPLTRNMTLAEFLDSDPEPEPPATMGPAALITSGGIVPAPQVAELVRRGAKVRPVRHPGDGAQPESNYHPSSALDRFVRSRDLTCRFPNCDRHAEVCDIDHTIPYPAGPTHPSNLKCLCRRQRLHKLRDGEEAPFAEHALQLVSAIGHTACRTQARRAWGLFRHHPVGQNHRPVASREADSFESDFPGRGIVGAVPPGQAIRVSYLFDMHVEIADQFVFAAEVLNMVSTGKAVGRVAGCPATADRAVLLNLVGRDPERIDDVCFLSIEPIFGNPDHRRVDHAGHRSGCGCSLLSRACRAKRVRHPRSLLTGGVSAARPSRRGECTSASRCHHLLKTFWTAWSDVQLPDGTVIWTSPTGKTYTTRPGSRLLFPALCAPTGDLPEVSTVEPPSSDRYSMMPKRRRTREQSRIERVDAERALNDAHVAERNEPPPF
jgi:hypothetical protein